MNACAIAIVFILASALMSSAQIQDPAEIIQKEGRFIFTDGSSYFLFEKDGAFQSGPVGLSGRTIEGHWKQTDGSLYLIEGRWGWVNGISQKDDFRKMTLAISVAQGAAEEEFMIMETAKPVKVYKCYFEIEELIKTSPGLQTPRP